MKKIVYLAPLALLGIGAKVSANQVPTHISNALRVYEQENKQSQQIGQSETEQVNYQAKPSLPNGQNQLVRKVEGATHISRLDSGLINEDGSVGNEQASQLMNISRTDLSTEQELSENKESVAGQYVQVQQDRVAQFNNGSKIYGLNNSNQLSKNNGDGYVITNAGTYNGRPVDIAVTTNNINEQQGSYTTKWSNGDKADVTGKTDASFKYENSVLAGTQQNNMTVPSQTRQGTASVPITVNSVSNTYLIGWNRISDDVYGGSFVISPKLLTDVKSYYNCDINAAAQKILLAWGNFRYDADPWIMNTPQSIKVKELLMKQASDDFYSMLNPDFNGDYDDGNGFYDKPGTDQQMSSGSISVHTAIMNIVLDSEKTFDNFKNAVPLHNFDDTFANNAFGSNSPFLYILESKNNTFDPNLSSFELKRLEIPNDKDELNAHFSSQNKYTLDKPMQVTDHLQLANKTDASLNYDYTVGVYDAQTGELIKDLTAEYKGKAGKAATDQDTAMNDAVKAKIQAINANNANAAYTGTAANDDVTFSKNIVHINYVNEQGQPISVPGYDIDVDNLTSGNYQVPQNYVLANTNGFKVTKNTHEVNGVTVTDSYNFIDQGHNKVTNNGKTLSVVLAHGTTHVDASHSGLSNDATANTFVINNGAKRQINSQSRHFGAAGVLDLVTNKVTKQGDWLISDKSNFDQTNINNDLVGYGNAIHSNLTFLTL